MAEKIVQTAGRDALGEFAPEFAHYNDEILFGENWNNTDIDLKTRSIITVVALMSQGVTSDALKFHLMKRKITAYLRRRSQRSSRIRLSMQAGRTLGRCSTLQKRSGMIKLPK